MTDPSRHSGSDRLLVVLPSADRYGSDRMLVAALPALVEAFRVEIVAAHDGPSLADARNLGASTRILPDFALARRHLRPGGALGYAHRARRALAAIEDAHRHDPFVGVYSNSLAAAIGGIVARRIHVPHVVHAHECPLRPAWLTRLLLAYAARTTDLLIANSRYTLGLIDRFSPGLATRGVVVPNGIDRPERVPTPAATGGPLRVTCVARLHPKKGHRVLLAAIDLARARGVDVELHCFGDALAEHRRLERDLRAEAERHGVDVTWHGYVPDESRYAGFHIAVVPSVVPEEFSLVTAEAHAHGLPVIATGPGGASEILRDGETGFVVAPNRAGDLADALVAVDRQRARLAAMGRAGERRVAQEFTRERYAARVTEAVQSATGSRTVAAGAERAG